MIFRTMPAVVLALLGVQATMTASTTYTFGAATQIAFASGATAYNLGVWTENFNTVGTNNEQIVCVVGLTVANETDTCGSPGPGTSQHIGITTGGQPGNSAILPIGTTNYLEVDGDPQYGAPVSTTMTGLIVGDTYSISFYQASNEEDGNNKAYSDSWQVYIIPSPGTGHYICPTPVCATAVNPGNLTPAFTSTAMSNPGGASTPWNFQTFNFTATATSEILEFVTKAVGTTPFAPPFLNLTGVSSNLVTPEPGTWLLTGIGTALLLASGTLRRRIAARRKRAAANQL